MRKRILIADRESRLDGRRAMPTVSTNEPSARVTTYLRVPSKEICRSKIFTVSNGKNSESFVPEVFPEDWTWYRKKPHDGGEPTRESVLRESEDIPTR